MANFLHGIELVDVEQGPQPITEVKTAVIGLVGIAPIGEAQKPILVLSPKDAAQFGERVPGFNIPDALEHIFLQGAGTVVVVNIFNEGTHTTNVVEEEKTIVDGKLKLANAPIGIVTILTQAGAATAYVKGTDYTLDEFGNFVVVPGRIANGTVLHFTYKKLNPAAVTAASIVGTVDVNGVRTGAKVLDLSFSKFGFAPKIIISPRYSALSTVADELRAVAGRLKGMPVLDGTYGWTPTEALAARGAASQFFTSDKRGILCYPYVKAYDKATDSENVDFPLSSFIAGVMARTDRDFGYWVSPSNQPIEGVKGLERPISCALDDENSEANLLNAAGIMTVFNMFGTGFRAWGNRNASYPTNKKVDSFISLVRLSDVVGESLQIASLAYQDKPLNQSTIDDIRESGNDFMKVLIARGALIPGSKVVFDRAENSNAELALGHIVFSIIFMGPTPAERITINRKIDISLLSVLK